MLPVIENLVFNRLIILDSLILTFADNVVKEETKGEEREIVIERKK